MIEEGQDKGTGEASDFNVASPAQRRPQSRTVSHQQILTVPDSIHSERETLTKQAHQVASRASDKRTGPKQQINGGRQSEAKPGVKSLFEDKKVLKSSLLTIKERINRVDNLKLELLEK